MPTLSTRNWSAWIELMPGMPPTLHVTGEVEAASPGLEPVLHQAVHGRTNPAILVLDLEVEDSEDTAGPAAGYRQVRFYRQATRGQYVSVIIREAGSTIRQMDVREVHGAGPGAGQLR